MAPPAQVDALIDEIHDTLRADLGLESAAALSAIFGSLRGERGLDPKIAEITSGLACLGERDRDLPSMLAARVLDAGARRFTGLYPTPAAITELAAELLDLPIPSRVLDPACGAGAFLRPFAARGHQVVGVDRSPQMIELARHVLGAASLTAKDALDDAGGLEGGFDAIVLNPPFGVHVDGAIARRYACGSARGRTPSEALFVELASTLLRPGGRLAAIVPAGFFSNRGLARARRVLGERLRLVMAVELPPETFMHAGARMSSVLFFAERRGVAPSYAREGEVLVERAGDAGHDRFGHPLASSDLARVKARMLGFLRGEPGTASAGALELSAAPAEQASTGPSARRLDALCAAVRLGKTPPKEAYAEGGHFIVKVGNLTGHGLDFTPRDRNFVTREYASTVRAGRTFEALTLRPGDLLVTSSAHARRYIAEKVDLVAGFPEWIEGPVFYVGELLLLRPNDPELGLDLLGYFRSDAGKSALRALSRGQTAHLLPRDVRALGVPAFAPSPESLALRALLGGEARRALELERERREIARLANQLHGGDTP